MQHDLAGGPVARDYGEEIGTPFKVFLVSGVTERYDKATGKLMTDIIDLPGLIASILQTRVLHPRKLSGGDLKFIRSALRMRSAEVAEVLDVSPEHYSRCESGTKTLSSSAVKSYRMYVYLQAAARHTAVQADLAKPMQCSPEEAKELVHVFRSVFLEMKIQHIFDAEDELEFFFAWKSPRREDEQTDCGKGDGKWQKGTQLKAA